MVRFALLFALVACSATNAAEVPLADALKSGAIAIEASGNLRDSASAKLTNTTDEMLALSIPVGTVLGTANGAKQITLRTLTTEIAAKSDAIATLPTAALASTIGSAHTALAPQPAQPKLAPLLALFEKQPDLPRPTAQLAVFILLEDISWANWAKWLDAKPPTPAQVAQAVDALGFVKIAVPALKPALLGDEGFKRLALRNPWARSKAMVLYGLTVQDAITGDPGLPPDLGKLLHTAPNDNCPICRQRADMRPEIP